MYVCTCLCHSNMHHWEFFLAFKNYCSNKSILCYLNPRKHVKLHWVTELGRTISCQGIGWATATQLLSWVCNYVIIFLKLYYELYYRAIHPHHQTPAMGNINLKEIKEFEYNIRRSRRWGGGISVIWEPDVPFENNSTVYFTKVVILSQKKTMWIGPD